MISQRPWVPAVVPPLVCSVFIASLAAPALALLADVSVLSLSMAAIVYLGSHTLRAVRLSILGTRILPVRARTLILLHFNSAPVSNVVPFKLGELYRLQQLMSFSDDFAKPVLLLLLERGLDGVSVICMSVILLAVGNTHNSYGRLLWVVIVVLAATVSVFGLLRPMLRSLQIYIFETHFSPRAIRVLSLIDSLRQSIDLAVECVRGNIVALVALSAIIWFLEAVTVTALFSEPLTHGLAYVIATLTLVTSPLAGVPASSTFATSRYGALTIWTLALFWPFATWFYVRRLKHGHLWPTRQRAKDGSVPLSALLKKRKLQLTIARRS